MKLTGKRFALYLSLGLLILYVLTVGIILARQGGKIQETVFGEFESNGKKVLSYVQQAAGSEPEDLFEKQLLFRRAMMPQLEMDGLSYPYYSTAMITDTKGNVMASRKNLLLCTIAGDGEDSITLPVTFENDNTAEMAELLGSDLSIRRRAYGSATFQGFWGEDGLFYLKYFRRNQNSFSSFTYEDESPAPEGAEMVSYQVPGDGKYLIVEPLTKSYGGIDSREAVKGWQRSDEVRDRLYGEIGWGLYLSFSPQGAFLVRSHSLFRTRVLYAGLVIDQQECFGERALNLLYGAEFSPLALALGEMAWSLILLGILFLAFGTVLVSSYAAVRQAELRGLQDEITRQQQALEYAQHAEQSRREMTSAIAHELKTPIAVLSSYAEALQENIDAEKQSHYMEVIREETGKMDQMVMELLDLSRLEAGKYQLYRENIDLLELAQEIVKPLEGRIQEKGLVIDYQVGERTVNADRYRLGQVLENYLTNAIRHSPEGGKITLRLGMNHETLSVENQGSSIPGDQLDKVWETFWQGDRSRSGKGSGLGLAICRSIMALHGGSCKVENTAQGVRFTANLSGASGLPRDFRIPKEERPLVLYPISQEYTTVENIFRRLELLEGIDLQREVKAGNILVGQEPVLDPKEKIYPGFLVSWQDFHIRVILNEEEKHYRLVYTRSWSGGAGNLENGPVFSSVLRH